MQDADLEYDPQEFLVMIKQIINGRADVVFGSLFMMGSQPHRVVYYWHMLGNRLLTVLSNMLAINLTDMETCYKALGREVIQSIRIEENRFGFEPEITAKVAKMGCRLHKFGILYCGRTYEEENRMEGWISGCLLYSEIQLILVSQIVPKVLKTFS